MFWQTFLAEMQSQFIDIDAYARCIALALTMDKNAIAWGPGGHGKSEGVQHALHLVRRLPEDVFVQNCGEGMTEERLFGGVDLGVLELERVIRYNAERSFLAHPYVVFEEMLDMPDPASLSLRDTLTARALRNGEQQFPMRTRSIFGLTNREPKAKAGNDQSVLAFMERFPIQMRVAWQDYSSANYSRLLAKVENRQPASDQSAGMLADALDETRNLYRQVSLNGRREVLATLLAAASANGVPVSPRIAADSMALVKAAAAIRGSSKVEDEDLADLAFSPALSPQLELLLSRFEVEQARQAAEKELGVTSSEAAGREELIASFLTRYDSLIAELGTARGATLNAVSEALETLEDEMKPHNLREEVLRRHTSRALKAA